MRCPVLLGLWALVVLSQLRRCESFSSFTTIKYSTAASTDSFINDDPNNQQSKPLRLSWKDRVHQLIEYREKHGHTLIPKRYSENPALGNWVNKQRQLYRKYLANEKPCSLTSERIDVLNDIGFCWDAEAHRRTSSHNATITWWKKLEKLRIHASPSDSLPSSLTSWMRQQREEYQNYIRGEECELDKEKVEALNDIDPDWWKSTRQCQWEARCKELVTYREKHGGCCVPISYENKRLANWVSNTRKNYNLKLADRHSTLTSDQIQELNEIGFVWNRWEHEYQKQLRSGLSQ
jgi:hypothetical protein